MGHLKFLKGNIGLLLLFIGYLYGLLFVFDLSIGLDYDIYCWMRWSTYLLHNGLGEAYSSETNYPPLFLYVLYLFAILQGTGDKIAEGIYALKHIVVLFDIGGVLLVLYCLNRFKKNVFLVLFLIFNIAFFYNTIIWGQVDSIHTFFVMAAIISAYNRKVVLSMACLVLALNMKLQAIVFVPLLIMIVIPVIASKWKILPKVIGSVLLLQFVILLPFITSGNLSEMFETVTGSVDYYPVVSMKAFNMWHMIFPTENLMTLPDTLTYLGVSYKVWGLILFVLFSVVILLPVFSRAMQMTIQRSLSYDFWDLKLLMLSAALIPLVFFFFNTQMHERYVHSAILFAAAYAMFSRHYFFYVIMSAAYFLNLERAMKAFNLGNYHTLIFETWFIAALFLLALIIGLYRLYSQYGKEVGVTVRILSQKFDKNRLEAELK